MNQNDKKTKAITYLFLKDFITTVEYAIFLSILKNVTTSQSNSCCC